MNSKPEMEASESAEMKAPGKPLIRSGFLWGALIFSLAGAALAVYATNLTFKLTVAGILEPSVCSFNDWISCDTVLSTSYAKMFGVPVAWFGFMYYLWAVIAVIYSLAYKRKTRSIAGMQTVLFLSLLAVLFSFFKIYQLIALGVLCPVCVGMYIANFGILFFSLKSLDVPLKKIFSHNIDYFKGIFQTKPQGKETKEANDKDGTGADVSPHPVRYFIIIGWLFAMCFFGLRYYENTVIAPSLANVQLILIEHFKQKPMEINTDAAAVKGNTESGIKIVEFSDFECPACKLLHANMKAIMLEYGDDVSLYFMNYPLDKSINENLKNEIHKNAGLAAIAGVCAQSQGGFWKYHDALFENQTDIDREFLTELAREQGLDMNKFKECMESEATRMRVISDIDEGKKKAGITGTPALFINGRQVKYWNSPEVVKAIIREEIRRKETP